MRLQRAEGEKLSNPLLKEKESFEIEKWSSQQISLVSSLRPPLN